MAGKKHHSDRIKLEAAALFASGLGVAEVSEALGVPTRTVYGWRRCPEFQAEVEGFLSERRRAIANQIQTLAPTALNLIRAVLESELKTEDIRPSHQLRAALGLITATIQNDSIAYAEKLDKVENLIARASETAENQHPPSGNGGSLGNRF